MAAATLVQREGENTMRAWVLEKPGDVAELKLTRVEVPEPGAGQVRVRVVASATNPVDWKHAGFAGMAAFPAVFGCDGAGVVEALGAGVEGLAVGDRVYFAAGFTPAGALGQWGSFAEAAIADTPAVFKIPAGVSFATAASLPVAAWTAHEALFDRMRIAAGQTVFIAAGAGGVGHVAVQLAKHAGCRVITTASGANVELLKARGAEVVDYKSVASVKDEVLKLTGGKGVDAAFDMLGEEQAVETMQLVKFAGQYTHIAVQAPALPGGAAFFNALTVHHVFMGLNFRPERLPVVRRAAEETMALVQAGALAVDISKVVPLEGVRDALLEQREGHVRGKIVVSMTAPLEAAKDAAYAPTA